MGLLFDMVREGVTALEAAERYGVKVNQHGRALCPWHADKHPSLSFRGQYCRCFACNNGGSAIDLTAQLFGISLLEAAQKLNNDFHIGADGKPTSRPQGPSKAQMREEAKRLLNTVWSVWCDREQFYRTYLASFGPGDIDLPEFQSALRELSDAQDMLERLNLEGTEVFDQWKKPSTHPCKSSQPDN